MRVGVLGEEEEVFVFVWRTRKEGKILLSCWCSQLS